MPEFVKFLLWAGAVAAAVYYVAEEVKPRHPKDPPLMNAVTVAEAPGPEEPQPAPDPRNLRIIALAQLAGESRDTPGAAVEFFHRADHPELMERFIVEAISHPDPLIRRNAAEVAGLMRLKAARPALEQRVQDPSREVQRAVVNSLKYAGDERSLFALVLALKSGFWETRLEAAEALGLHGGVKALRYLWTALSDPEPLVAETAGESLLKIAAAQRGKAAPFFRKRLRDADASRAELARKALDIASAPASSPEEKAGPHAGWENSN